VLSLAAFTANSQALWYLTRGFGLIALVLLTLTMVMGLLQVVRYARPGLPRFVIAGLHRNVSLLAMVLLAVHILTAVLDSYAPIHIVDVFVPFVSAYRPLWLGLGALSLDLLVAVTVTSLVRERLGHRAWRIVHWTAYACWPLAVVHGLGTGTDTKLGWVLLINIVCIASVLAALWWRLAWGWSAANAARRGVAIAGSVALPVAVGAWALAGPLQPGWARRAGTPANLIGAGTSTDTRASTTTPTGALGGLTLPIHASFEGFQRSSGPDSTTIDATFGADQNGRLTVVLQGGGPATLGTTSDPTLYAGPVTLLDGDRVEAALRGPGGQSVTLTITVQGGSGTDGGAVRGRIDAT
jgi:Ferric reductase like transmembrane component